MSNVPIDPSTYKQVVKNARALANLGDLSNVPYDISQLYEYVNTLKQMILDAPTTGGDGDVTVDDDNNMKVVGIHVNTTNSEVNNLIADYNQGVTFEIKNTLVIGLRGSEGYTGDYCLVQTNKQDSSLEGEPNVISGFTPFQIAYGTDGLYMCRRDAQPDGSWGEWSEISGARGSGGQIIQMDEQPPADEQEPGDYWMEPITPGGGGVDPDPGGGDEPGGGGIDDDTAQKMSGFLKKVVGDPTGDESWDDVDLN